MSSDIEVRTYQAGDEERITDLLRLVFKDWPGFDLQCTPVDHWKWKIIDSSKKMNIIVMAEKNNEIIGVTQGIFINIKIGDKIFYSQKGAEAAVHPDHRGKGIWSKISNLEQQLKSSGIAFTIGQTDNPILIKMGDKRGNLSFPFTIRQLFRIKNIDKHLVHDEKHNLLRKQILKYGFLAKMLMNKFAFLLEGNRSKRKQSFKITRVERFDSRINIFWDKIKDQYDFITEKKVDYLNWRYCDPRGGSYEVYIAEKNNEMLGHIVLRVNRINETYPQGYIMEFHAHPGRLDVVDALLDHAVNRFDELDVNIAYAVIVENHPYEKRLSNAGFLYNKKNLSVNIRSLSVGEMIEKFLKSTPDKVNFQYGETDSI